MIPGYDFLHSTQDAVLKVPCASTRPSSCEEKSLVSWVGKLFVYSNSIIIDMCDKDDNIHKCKA